MGMRTLSGGGFAAVLLALLVGSAGAQTLPPASARAAESDSASPPRWLWRTGGEVRVRYEAFENDEFGGGAEPDHDFVWGRALPWLELRGASGFRAVSQLVLAFESGDEAGESPIDEDRADLLQAFAEFRHPAAADRALSAWAGRRVLALGSERLISGRLGPNVPRAFDAAGVLLENGLARLDLFWARPVLPEAGEFDDEADRTRSLFAAYGTQRFGEGKGVDLYLIGAEDESAQFDQGAGREERYTLGARPFGRAGAWEWNTELFAQWGSFAEGEIRAWSVATDTAHTFASLPADPRLGLRANVISGDDDPADPDLETFQPLYPKGKYFGEAGILGPANLINLHPSLEFALSPRWTLGLAAVWYWRESTGDGIYDLSGGVIRPNGGSKERFIGTQLDLSLGFEPREWLALAIGGSLFEPGDFIEETGDGETVRFIGGEAVLHF